MKAKVFRTNCAQLLILLLTPVMIAGCRSHHVEITVENRTGAAIQLLEVDYPSASFGADALASDGRLNYSIQVRGTGPVKVQYKVSGGAQQQISGPSLAESDEGMLEIVLLPNGKASFAPQISHQH
jgi:hypothetical protein